MSTEHNFKQGVWEDLTVKVALEQRPKAGEGVNLIYNLDKEVGVVETGPEVGVCLSGSRSNDEAHMVGLSKCKGEQKGISAQESQEAPSCWVELKQLCSVCTAQRHRLRDQVGSVIQPALYLPKCKLWCKAAPDKGDQSIFIHTKAPTT